MELRQEQQETVLDIDYSLATSCRDTQAIHETVQLIHGLGRSQLNDEMTPLPTNSFCRQARTWLNVFGPCLRHVEATQSDEIVRAVFDVHGHLDLPSGFLIGHHLIIIGGLAIPIVVDRSICDRKLIEEGVICLPRLVRLEQLDCSLVETSAGRIYVVDPVSTSIRHDYVGREVALDSG